MVALDHIVLVAESLEQGVSFVAEQLGISPQPAWSNALFGTHSLGLRLGAQCHLEIIAIDPLAAPPACPRWYHLDDVNMQRTLMRRPRLFGWVVRVPDIDAAISNAAFEVGEAIAMQQGDLSWRQTVPHDGALILHGAGPSLIQRSAGSHPAQWLPDQGCTIAGFRLSDEAPEVMRRRLASVGADGLVTFEQGNRGESRIEMTVRTPHGTGLLL